MTKGFLQVAPPIDMITVINTHVSVPCPKPQKLGRKIPNLKHKSLFQRGPQSLDGKGQKGVPEIRQLNIHVICFSVSKFVLGSVLWLGIHT